MHKVIIQEIKFPGLYYKYEINEKENGKNDFAGIGWPGHYVMMLRINVLQYH